VPEVYLSSGHVRPIRAGHPWVFAQAIERVEGAPAAGEPVRVRDPQGHVLGSGFWSPKSAIPVRILCRTGEPLDDAWLGRRLDAAFERRQRLLGIPDDDTTGYRLVHAEGDGLAGLIVDVYGSLAAVQFLTAGMKRRQDALVGHIARVTGVRSIFEAAHARTQRIEGFEVSPGIIRGPDVDVLRFTERGFRYEVPLEVGQKTGFYFDQRDNRARVEALARGRTVLDAFAYVGAFSLSAARGGAERVVAVDSSPPAVATASTLLQRHGYGQRAQVTRANLKQWLAATAARGERFDLVVLDPPKLVPTARHLKSGRRAYQQLNARGLKLVTPGGLLVTCSCSGAVSADDHLRLVGLAARDAGREVRLLWEGRQAPDHPVPPAFAEGRYLKCAMLEVQ
jgi:23S rRNA (cytosine1962-C5)-methyltransferase